MPARLVTLAAAALAAAALGAGCGGSSVAPVSDSSAPKQADAAATTHEAATTTDEASPATAAAPASPSVRRIDPRRNGLEIAMGEWALKAEASVIRPGLVTFVVTNRGKVGHGFEIEADEDSSGPGGDGDRYKTESRLLSPGETVRLRLELPAGVYKVECLVDGHDDLGMESLLKVRTGAPLAVEKRQGRKPNAVAITGFAFRPGEIMVRAGQAVTWRNEDPAEHTVTHEGDAFASKTLGQGARFRTVFDRPGTYRYLCALHPEMKGTVVVTR